MAMNFKNTEVYGFDSALRGMRNPMSSWDRADSESTMSATANGSVLYHIGDNDMKLAQNLIRSGSEHAKFLRMIHVSVDIDAPRYIWAEFDTYHYNTKNSCSTMHKLLNNNNPITLSDEIFSYNKEDEDIMLDIVARLEYMRKEYKDSTTSNETKTKLLIRAKSLLPECYMQLRTVDTNYAEIRSMYFQRRTHRLPEWSSDFVEWVEKLPYARQLICLE